MVSWAEALTHHSPPGLLALLERERKAAEERVRTLGAMIDTVREVVDSEPLWRTITLPGPLSAPTSPMSAAAEAPEPAAAGGTAYGPERTPGDGVLPLPGVETAGAPHGDDRAERLAAQADHALGAMAGTGLGGFSPEGEDTVAGQPTKRERVIALMLDAPNRWWSALDLCAKLGIPGQRRIRPALNTMIRNGELVRRKEPGKKHVYYRLAPQSAEGVQVSG
ncbi:hypothetical protein [Kitasatospora sp. P5_F3]